MSTTSMRSLFLLAAATLAAPACGTPAVICLPEVAHYRYVGDIASDGQCTDDNIQHAIDNAPCPDTNIVITGEHTYTAQHLEIDGKNLALTGTTLGCGPPGLCDSGCPPPPTSPIITISGSGHGGDSVLYIHGTSNVTLKFLTISDGSNFNGNNPTYGGGIHFVGQGSLTLDTTTVRDNQAMYGGGINFTGSGGFAGLALLGHTQIVNNSAGASGGGIRIDGGSYMSVLYDSTIIWLNHAPAGYGGGVNVVGPAHADIGSPGFGALGAVYSNDAKYGGGIAITGGSDSGDDGEVQLFTIDPARPVHVHDNFASSSGGGVYLKTYYSLLDGARHGHLCAHDFRIDNNAAPEGSAVQASGDSYLGLEDFGSGVWLNRTDNNCHGLPAYAQRCAQGTLCNTISGNISIDEQSTETLGAAIRLESDSVLHADRLSMRATHGGNAIRFSEDSGGEISNCLLAGNQLTRQLLRTETGDLAIGNCTLAGNTIASTETIYAGGALTLQNSIVDQPGNQALSYTGDPFYLHVKYVLSSDVSTLPAGEGVLHGAPAYVDAATGDYHLKLTSLGLDFAPHVTGNNFDLDRLAHDRDLPGITNAYGALDLGAYERQFICGAIDTVFCSGFETN